MTLGGFLGLGGTFAFVLGLLFVTLRLLRGLPALAGRQTEGPELRVLSRAALSPRQGVATVQAGDRVLVIGYGEGGVHAISELPGTTVPATLNSAVPAPALTSAADTTQPDAAGPVTGDRTAITPSDLRWAPVADDFATTPASAGNRNATQIGNGLPANGMPFRQAFAKALRQARLFVIASLALGATTLSPIAVQAAPVTAAAATSVPIAQEQAPAQGGVEFPSIDLRVGDGSGDDLTLEGPVGTVLFVGFLTLIPTLLLMMTGFTRILVVLHLLKQALGTQTAPPAHLLAAMALLLTGFVMAPSLETAHTTAIKPWMDGEIDEMAMITTASVPFREFMAASVRQEDLRAFMEMSNTPPVETVEEIPLVVLTAAFVTSELRAAFQMGFALFLPFVIIDIVVASVLMSMGMFMLPPVMVSLPFKLLLFVLVDGWALVMGSIVKSFA